MTLKQSFARNSHLIDLKETKLLEMKLFSYFNSYTFSLSFSQKYRQLGLQY